jgi:hypothetical protein
VVNPAPVVATDYDDGFIGATIGSPFFHGRPFFHDRRFFHSRRFFHDRRPFHGRPFFPGGRAIHHGQPVSVQQFRR